MPYLMDNLWISESNVLTDSMIDVGSVTDVSSSLALTINGITKIVHSKINFIIVISLQVRSLLKFSNQYEATSDDQFFALSVLIVTRGRYTYR